MNVKKIVLHSKIGEIELKMIGFEKSGEAGLVTAQIPGMRIKSVAHGYCRSKVIKEVLRKVYGMSFD